MSGDMLLGVHISVLNTLVVFLHTHLFFSALIKQLYTLCKPALASLYSPSLAQGHLGELFRLLFLCLHIHPTFPPSPAAPKHRPSLGCVALPRLSHQAPLNLTCFSHFLHQRERERARERERRRHTAVSGGCVHWKLSSNSCTGLTPGRAPSSRSPFWHIHPPPPFSPPLLRSLPAAVWFAARTSPVRRGGWQQVFGASHPPHGAMQRRPVLPGSPAAANRAF